MKTPSFLIGITGGSGSGKTTISSVLCEKLAPNAAFLSEDNYYLDIAANSQFDASNFDFDTPSIRDHKTLHQDLSNFKKGNSIAHPNYDFAKHKRSDAKTEISSKKFLIIEGTHILHDPKIRKLLNLKIFIHTDEELRFSRRLERDINERGRTAQSVYEQYEKSVLPGHFKWTEPTREFADLVLDCNDDAFFNAQQIIEKNIETILNSINTMLVK
jgi:uridine kinase